MPASAGDSGAIPATAGDSGAVPAAAAPAGDHGTVAAPAEAGGGGDVSGAVDVESPASVLILPADGAGAAPAGTGEK
ncbi:MAG: hypothetical protein ACRENE_01755, partial [Polyangiaceae bacterium]